MTPDFFDNRLQRVRVRLARVVFYIRFQVPIDELLAHKSSTFLYTDNSHESKQILEPDGYWSSETRQNFQLLGPPEIFKRGCEMTQ